MIQLTSFVIALFFSAVFTMYILYENKKTEEKKDNMQMFILSIMSFIIVYMISNLIIDSNDDKQIMNNIKSGEPPF
tara:strand:+ start:3260 stop:3487 length:228 start_codon:yes stop_codon:yes gene_type:complete